MQGIGLFRKEAKIYSEILAAMPCPTSTKWAPKSYYTRNDILVLDDLSIENYHLMPTRHDFSKKHVQLVLKSLATMHANSVYLEKHILKKSIGDVYGEILFEVSVDESNVWFNKGIAAIKTIALKRTRFSKDPKMLQWIQDNFDHAITKVFEISRNYPKEFTKVFCHRDIWRNNLMYKFGTDETNQVDYDKPLESLLIDYQIARYMPPAADVNMTLYMLQRAKVRAADFQKNLKYYYEQLDLSMKELNMNIEEFLSFKDLLETIDYFKLLGAILKCIFLQMTHLPDGEIDKIHADDDVYHQFIMVDRGDILIKYLDTDEYFRNWMVESVEELVEMLIDTRN